ncbi:pectin acetylesterase-family hydrolase [Anaeromyxobacter soli]|uniref:pectin acetylesterase-family hydrolase n=1 Tax=Anaeromyxobacter soli TaxID=2922725 RepID=UPI001FAF7C2C|nr:pectin acetylesterase-family hydrolase [Anaeromyxobacter sp. SG29]
MRLRRLVPAVLAAALAACAQNTTPIEKKGYTGKPPLGQAISEAELPLETWAWIPFDDAVCADGSTTGLAVNRGSGSDLLVFFDGGGACWDYATCAAGTAVDDHYGPAQWDVELRDYVPSSLTDRANLPPSLAGATIVFVPYCTGDVHGGSNVKVYGNAVFSETWRHVGHANVLAYLARLAPTFPSPRKLVVAGSSAGGFGALVSYEAFRWYWPEARGYLVDDSGPALVNNDVPADLRDAFYGSWHLGEALDPVCVECRSNLSAAFSELSSSHAGDRIAFLSHVRDPVMATFMLSTPDAFEASLRELEALVFAPTGNARVFYDTDGGQLDAHMLLTPATPFAGGSYVASHEEGGTTLAAWLELMVSDDPRWTTVMPP